MANLTAVQNLTLVPEIFNVANTFTDGVLGIMILMVVFFGLMMLMSAFSRIDSFLSASFVTFTLSIFLRYLNLVSDLVVGIVIVIFFGSLVVAYMSKDSASGA
ncbi:hypothetical protein LCGC14_2167520 [marine sediment metagenome]|uniref:Uncharacterized protein n=1 Tax=marine sediment metagenome TaxID=412755 RepID=A0A0F9DQV0_9ZZZZ